MGRGGGAGARSGAFVQAVLQSANGGLVATGDGYDELIRRLRARMEGSASRERSLDWRAAGVIEELQARVVELEQENAHLRDEGLAERDAITTPEGMPPVDESPVASAAPAAPAAALSIQQAAALLNVSYATVFAHKRNLGFFQVGRVWRVTLEGLKAATSGSALQQSAVADRVRSPSGRVADPRSSYLSPSARQAARELDALLKNRRKRSP